jgi:hypothetical protein
MEVPMVQADNSGVFFREEQQFRQPWILLVILPPTLFGWFLFILQIVLGKPFGSKPAPDFVVMLVFLLTGIGVPALFYFTRLLTEVRQDGIYYRYIPFHWSWQTITFDRIKSVEARTYRPLMEFGGWGIRYGRNGKAYNVSGNRGLQLMMSDGKGILFGSKKPEEFRDAVRAAAQGTIP